MSSTVLRRGGPSDGASLFDQGIDKVCRECKINGNPEPEFSLFFGGVMAILRQKENSDNKDLNSEGVQPSNLTGTQEKILTVIRGNPYLSSAAMAKEIGVSERAVRYNISKLEAAGIIKKEGDRKNRIWHIV